MKTVATKDAVGHVLCHDLTRIVRGEMKGAQFKKGHIVREEDIPMLLSMGKENLFVWEKREGFLHEDEAAFELDAVCQGMHIMARGPSEGKIELYATTDGLFRVDVARLDAINAIDGLTVASRKDFSTVHRGDLLAGLKSVPLVIDGARLQEARVACPAPCMNVLPYRLKSAAIVTTGNEVASGTVSDTFTPVLREKLAAFGIDVCGQELPGDGIERIAQAIERLRERKPDIILCTGGMSVDPDDGTPSAISGVMQKAGGRIVTYGAPVMPGAMFLLAYFADDVPVVGLPGCVMYAKATVFDFVLPRLAAGIVMEKKDFIRMGHGGLCFSGKGCTAPCRYPACTFGN